jgi:hypothetical protein
MELGVRMEEMEQMGRMEVIMAWKGFWKERRNYL